MPKSVVATSTVGRAIDLGRAGVSSLKLRKDSQQVVADNARVHLAQRLGRLRGLPQKMGQILSMSDDTDTADAFADLTDSAQPIELDALLPVLEDQWGRDPKTVYSQIDPKGMAASLGQVHRATLNDGTEVAIKIQYPGIVEAVEADLKMLGWISKPLGGFSRGFDLDAYRDAIRGSLNEELDYIKEAEHQQNYARASRELDIVVPEVIQQLSTERILVTKWETGDTLEQAKTWPVDQRKALTKQLMQHFLVMLFEHGLVHGDPHAGNYRFRNTDSQTSIVLYDYGCVRAVSDDERLTLLRLIYETHNVPEADPYPLFVKLGFAADTLEPLRRKLPALSRVLFDPFSTPMKFDLKYWKRGERINDVLGDDRWNFRISGPASMIFLMRAFHGLIYYLRELQEPVSWTQYYRPLIRNYKDEFEQLDIPIPSNAETSFACLAKHLCIKVTDSGTVKAKVTLPAEAIDELHSVIDDEVKQKIESRGITLTDMVRKVRRTQYAPQEVFNLEDGNKRYEVWMQ